MRSNVPADWRTVSNRTAILLGGFPLRDLLDYARKAFTLGLALARASSVHSGMAIIGGLDPRNYASTRNA
jgi:hypothetical protein